MKSTIYNYLLSGTLFIFLGTSCNTDNQISFGDKAAVNITAGVGGAELPAEKVMSRAVDAQWGANDHIGITMLEYPLPASQSGESPVGIINDYTNKDYVTATGDGHFLPNPSDQVMYYPIDGSAVTFKAYYPYRTNLSADYLLPVDVTSQNNLAELDLMTAVHTNGSSSKDAPNVNLQFYHRLSKVIINLDSEAPISLDNCKLALKGMKTTGQYDLMHELLSVHADSDADIQVPLKNKQAHAILLPREAGSGVTFEVTTADGGVYTAMMKSDLELKSGYKYTFNVKLKLTPTEVTAAIEPWIEGSEQSMEVVRVVTDLGTNSGFKENDQLQLYLKETETANGSAVANPEFKSAMNFTYSSNLWVADTPLYWENINGDPAFFRGTSIMAAKLNNTQMDDILISDDTSVNSYKGIHLAMKHAGSKIQIKLTSSDGTFSASDLENAEISLPDYVTGGTLNAATGAFEAGSSRTSIIPEDGIAIFPPQIIQSGKALVSIKVNGRVYEVKANPADFSFEKGTAYKFTLDLKKAEIKMSTEVIDWVEKDLGTTEVQIGTAGLGTNGGDLNQNDELYLYTGDALNRTPVNGHFTYNGSTWNYSETTPLYWENITHEGSLYASITRPAISGTSGNYQSKDYITAEPVANDGGTANTALNFKMSHQVAKVDIRLTSDIYTPEELKSAEISLPKYKTGGTVNNGVYQPGTAIQTILLENPNNTEISTSVYLQPQTISSPATLVAVKIKGRTYLIKHTVSYVAGEITHLTIDIKASELLVSVNITPWIDQEPVELKYFFTEANTSVSGFEHNDKIKFYEMGTSGVTSNTNTYTYTVSGNTASLTDPTHKWYRDDFQKGDQLAAVFPVGTDTDIADGETTFSWTCKGNPTGSEATNAHQDDVMIANPTADKGTIAEGSANVALEFKHVLSKVTLNIFAGEGFTTDELKAAADQSTMYPTLLGFKPSGTVDITNAVATVDATATAIDITPTRLGQTPNKAAASYEALIMPQTITKDVFVTVTLNGYTYQAIHKGGYDFTAGENHVFDITLKKTALLISTSVAPWETGTGGSMIIQ